MLNNCFALNNPSCTLKSTTWTPTFHEKCIVYQTYLFRLCWQFRFWLPRSLEMPGSKSGYKVSLEQTLPVGKEAFMKKKRFYETCIKEFSYFGEHFFFSKKYHLWCFFYNKLKSFCVDKSVRVCNDSLLTTKKKGEKHWWLCHFVFAVVCPIVQ